MKSQRKVEKTFSDPAAARNGVDSLFDGMRERGKSTEANHDTKNLPRDSKIRPKSSKGRQRQPVESIPLPDSGRSTPASITWSSRATPTIPDSDSGKGTRVNRPKSSKGRARGMSVSDLRNDEFDENFSAIEDEAEEDDIWSDDDKIDELKNKEVLTRPKSSKLRSRGDSATYRLNYDGDEFHKNNQSPNKEPAQEREDSATTERPKTSWIEGRRNPRFTDGIATAEELEKELDYEIENFNIRDKTSKVDEVSDISYDDSDDELRLYANSLLSKTNYPERSGQSNPLATDLGVEPVTTRSDETNPRSLQIAIPSTRSTSIADLQYVTARERILDKYGRSVRSQGQTSRGRNLPVKLKPLKTPNGAGKLSIENGHNGILSRSVDGAIYGRYKNVANTEIKNKTKLKSNLESRLPVSKHKPRPLVGRKGKKLLQESGMRDKRDINNDGDEDGLISSEEAGIGKRSLGNGEKTTKSYGRHNLKSTRVSISAEGQRKEEEAGLDEVDQENPRQTLERNESEDDTDTSRKHRHLGSHHNGKDTLPERVSNHLKSDINREIEAADTTSTNSPLKNTNSLSNHNRPDFSSFEAGMRGAKENAEYRFHEGTARIEKYVSANSDELRKISQPQPTIKTSRGESKRIITEDSWGKQSLSKVWQSSRDSKYKV